MGGGTDAIKDHFARAYIYYKEYLPTYKEYLPTYKEYLPSQQKIPQQ